MIAGHRGIALGAAAYAVWLGAWWLSIDVTSHELPIFAARVWETRQALSGGHLSWWSTFMSGSSRALDYGQGLYLLVWGAFSVFTGLLPAGKLTVLTAIAVSGTTMYACARRFVKSELGAVLAAAAYVLHPQQLVRAAALEHVTVSVFIPLVPLAWLSLARVVERRRVSDGIAAAFACAAMVWAHNKLAFIEGLYLGLFLALSVIAAPARDRARLLGRLAATISLAALLAAFVVVPVLVERPLAKLFAGDPLDAWRAMYAIAPRDLVHRGGAEYAGIVTIALAAIAIIAPPATREERRRARVFAALLVTSGLLASGPVFAVLARLWLVRDVRAPAAFFEVPGMFFAALLVGFAGARLEDARWLGSPRRRAAFVAAGVVLLALDAWPHQAPMRASDVPSSTIANARALYPSLGRLDPEGRAYFVSTRFFHLLSPVLGGPAQATESAYEYMAPRGMGLLHARSLERLSSQLSFFNRASVRWVVFDKSDPLAGGDAMNAQLAAYRRSLPVHVEDADFVVFRNEHAKPLVSGTRLACLAYGDSPALPDVALTLAGRGFALVHAEGEVAELASRSADELARYRCILVPSAAADVVARLAPEVRAKVVGHDAGEPLLPPRPSPAPGDPIRVARLVRPRIDELLAELVVAPDGGATAVIAESWYPFWHARVDGREAEVLRVDYGLMGLALSPGEHAIELRYEPPRIYGLAACVSLGAVLGCLLLLMRARTRARRTSNI